MNTIILILFIMMFLHIYVDFNLQIGSSLNNLKQKDWWRHNCNKSQYKYDYIMAMLLHSFSWTFGIMFAPVLYLKIKTGYSNSTIFINCFIILLFVINAVAHYIIDNLKANDHVINLWVDQIGHIIQILITWFILLHIIYPFITKNIWV